MALITCPECGNQVSDKAPHCIHCGAPLKIDKTVKIKIPRFAGGMIIKSAAKAEVLIQSKVVWSGYSGQVAEFQIDYPTVTLVKIIQAYTGYISNKDFFITGHVDPGKKYEIKNTEVSLFGDPTKGKYAFSAVDVIDSGL